MDHVIISDSYGFGVLNKFLIVLDSVISQHYDLNCQRNKVYKLSKL